MSKSSKWLKPTIYCCSLQWHWRCFHWLQHQIWCSNLCFWWRRINQVQTNSLCRFLRINSKTSWTNFNWKNSNWTFWSKIWSLFKKSQKNQAFTTWWSLCKTSKNYEANHETCIRTKKAWDWIKLWQSLLRNLQRNSRLQQHRKLWQLKTPPPQKVVFLYEKR